MSELPTRALGIGGPEITTVGFGAWAIGGDWKYGWGHQDDHDSIAAIHRALDVGINWIDTAAVYGLGHSEEVVERALRGVSERPLVFTKCGLVWHDRPDGVPFENLRPAEIRRECEESLRRLGVEQIDLYQFHWPDRTGTPIEDSWGVMAELVKEGKVRWAGVSNFDVALLERCEPIMHVDSLQPPFNAIDRAVAAEILPWCVRNGTGVIVYSPMASGLLTGAFSAERMTRLEATDWRHGFDEFQEPKLSRNLALQDALRPVAERHGVSVAAVAVAWTRAWQGVTAAIVGARTAAQVDGWIAAADLTLRKADLVEIGDAIASTGAGAGPVVPPGI
jgi:aryl-alcohol dehydrogenase-like predicted oxidoreductase